MLKPEKDFEMEVARDLETLNAIAVGHVTRLIHSQVNIKDKVSLVLSGGTTPRRLYESLATPASGKPIPWERVHLFWGDERCVPPDHAESNYRMARESLIDHIPIPSENIHRMHAEESDPNQAAEIYEHTLREFFGATKPEWPHFDLVLLGVGADGHTASLFPDSPVLDEKKRWVAATYVEALKVMRLTLTLPVFNHAAQVLFLVAGKEKSSVMKEAGSSDPSQKKFPYQRIHPPRGKVIYLMDQNAAGTKTQI